MKRPIALLLLVPAFVSVASAQDYTVTFLGTLGGAGSDSAGISDSGYVTGFSGIHAFVWKDGTMTDLGTLGGIGSRSMGQAVNASGDVVGWSDSHAFLYQNGTMRDIGGQYGWGINDAGTAVGSTLVNYVSGFLSSPFIYNYGTTVLYFEGSAQAINNLGQVVGYGVGSNGNSRYSRAFLYQHGVVTDLGLPVNGSFASSSAMGISENGNFIVGSAGTTTATGAPTRIAFLDSRGKMIALGTLGGAASWGLSVNNSGEVVGFSDVSSVAGRPDTQDAFLYRNGKMVDLNSLISPNLDIQLQMATGINDEGWIAATAWNDATGAEAVLLKPSGRGVPEPATLGLLGLGITVLALAQGRHRLPNLERCPPPKWNG